MPYPHILLRAWNTPLWIAEEKLSILNDKVFMLMLANPQAIDRSAHAMEQKPVEPKEEDTIVIPIEGTLVQKNAYGASGMTSYQWIDRSITQAIADGYKNIVLAISSPGGEVFGNDTLARKIANNVSLGINIVAYVDGQACSAAYAIAAACKAIYTTKASMLSSIGTVMTLVDVTKADAKDGVKYHILRSKAKKALYNPHETISEEVITKQEAILAEFDTQFNDLVTSIRPKVTSELISKLEGDTVMAAEAVELGLADEIVTGLDDVLAKLGNTADTEDSEDSSNEFEIELDNSLNPSNLLNKTTEFNMPTTANTTTIPSDLPSALQAIAVLQAQVETANNATTIAVQAAVLQERGRCEQIAKAAAAFHLPLTNASSAITKGHSLDVVAEIFTAQAQAQALQTQVSGGAEGALQATLTDSNNKDKPIDLTAIIKANMGLGLQGLEAKQETPVAGTKVPVSAMATNAGIDVSAIQDAMQLSAEDYNL